jgi:hypothetical protein
MRVDRATVARFRAIFGLGYILFGGLALWRVLAAPAPANAKLLGALFGLALIALGVARLAAFAKARREVGR